MLLDMPVLLILPHDSEWNNSALLAAEPARPFGAPVSIDQLKAHLDFSGFHTPNA